MFQRHQPKQPLSGKIFANAETIGLAIPIISGKPSLTGLCGNKNKRKMPLTRSSAAPGPTGGRRPLAASLIHPIESRSRQGEPEAITEKEIAGRFFPARAAPRYSN